MNISEQQKKWIDYAVTTLLIVVTIVCFMAVVQTAVAGEVIVLGHRIFYVATGSMEPTIPTGSLIWVDVESQDYEVGDVITFYSKDSAIYNLPNTHRIVEVMEDGTTYRTQGDANATADIVLVEQEDVIGELDGQLAVGGIMGSLVSFLNTRWGFFFVILCPLVGLTTACLRDFAKAYREEVRRAVQLQLEKEGEIPQATAQPQEEAMETSPVSEKLQEEEEEIPPVSEEKEESP